jgi:hypothetical protein
MKPKIHHIAAFVLAVSAQVHGATFSMNGDDTAGTTSFNSGLHWAGGAAPASGNDYLNAKFTLRTPGDAAAYTFAGTSLTITGDLPGTTNLGQAFMYKGSASSTITVNDLTVNGGHIRHASSETQIFTLAGTKLTIGTNGANFHVQGPVNITSSVQGSGNISIVDSGSTDVRRTVTFSNSANTMTGNLSVPTANRSRFVLGSTGNFNFVIGANGVNNAISGAGAATFNGVFKINLASASTTVGHNWTLVAASVVKTYAEGFTVENFTSTGTAGSRVWTHSSGSYQFSEATGVLTVMSVDQDSDGLPDEWELANFGNKDQISSGDPDGDSFTNSQEYTAGSNPNSASSTPNDLDADGLLDSWETTHFGNITNYNGASDPDGDFATNSEEMAASTSPADSFIFPDTDFDGMSDAWETFYLLNVGVDDSTADPDGDDHDNLAEFFAKSSPNDAGWTPEKAKLTHRWSFNGSLSDTIGTSHAQIIDPDSNAAVGGVATLSATDVQLAGGARASSDYINLGSNLLSGTKSPITIELWATQVEVKNWSRIFDFGSSDAEYAMMAWTQGTALATDNVEWRDVASTNSANKAAPYTLGTEYHIVMTVQPGAGGSGTSLVTFYSAPSNTSLGAAKGSFTTANSLADLNDLVMYLGRSQFTGDDTASARYNECRIWNGNLTSTERETYHVLGADVVSATDVDGDGLADTWENTYFGNITSQDASGDPDGDLYVNSDEFIANTNPTVQFSSPDSDGDTLPDGWEVFWFREGEEDLFTVIGKYSATGATDSDPDGDGFKNGAEYTAGTNPNSAASNPLDTDADGLVDSWEQNHFASLVQTSAGNPDGDSGTNVQEQNAGSDPNSAVSTVTDADGDGVVDTAEVFQPYTADSDTLHLWHLDEVKVPVSDSGSIPVSFTSLENNALLWTPSLAAFKTGINTSAGRGTAASGVLAAYPLAADTTDDTTMTYAGADGAFTFEAIVKIGFDPAAPLNPLVPMQIVAGESDAGTSRVWQFRISPTAGAPVLQFINLHGEVGVQTISANLPTGAAANAIVQNGWYHVAVAYNGSEATADNLKLYWTELNPSNTQASELLSTNMTFDLITAAPDLTIGNEGRSTGGSTDGFDGIIDEVRISSVARTASQFMFFSASNDVDSDGMDDTWETTYFGGTGQAAAADYDGDGTSNLTEYRLGLVPNSGSSRFSVARGSNGLLTWPSAAGLTFKVQRSVSLAAWETIATISGAAGTSEFTDLAPPSGKAFYRVTLEP